MKYRDAIFTFRFARAALCLAGLLCCILAGAPNGAAQTAGTGGTLEGTVQDASGAAVPGAEILLRNVPTHQLRTLTADSQGLFRVAELPVGRYDLQVEQAGFAPYRLSGVSVSVGQTVRLNISLSPAAVKSQVTVTAQPPLLDVSQTSTTFGVGREPIEELPVRTRNALDFVLLSPGVTTSPPPLVGAIAPVSGGLVFGGLRPRSNSISIDGLDNNDEYSGSSRTELSPEIVQEFLVVNNGLSAEYGGASGGSINVVTRSGTDQVHGDAFVFEQRGTLDARDPIGSPSSKPTVSRYRLGLSNGGPLIKDRTFYYAAFEQESQRGQGDFEIPDNIAAPLNAFLAAGNFPRLGTRRLAPGVFPVARAETEASAKLDHQLDARHTLMLRYAFINNRVTSNAFNTDVRTDPSARGSSFTIDHALVGSFTTLLSPRAANDLRFQWALRHLTLRTNQTAGPEVRIAGLADFGRPYAGNHHHREEHEEVSDTLVLSRGRHLVKTGGVVNHVGLRANSPDGFGGVFIFPTPADFLAGRADFFLHSFGDPASNFSVTSYGTFAQDHWSVKPRLTADLGLRYDFEHLPAGFRQDMDNFSPRVGLAFSPTHRWVLRAGFGMFYDRNILANLNRVLIADGVHGFQQVADGAQAAALFQQAEGGPVVSPISGIQPSVFRPDPHLETSYSQQASAEIECELAPHLSLNASFLYVRGVKLSRTRNINLTPPVVLIPQNAPSLGVTDPSPQQLGRPFFGPARLNSALDNLYLLEDSASSAYRGLSVTLHRRLAQEIEFSASYTLSRTLDDASDFDQQPQNPYDLRAEWALSPIHQAQRFVFSGLFELPFGEEEDPPAPALAEESSGWLERILAHTEIAPIVTLGSGRPVNPLTGLDSNWSDAFPLAARRLGFRRDSLQTPALAAFDCRLLKYFPFRGGAHLDLVIESFNLLNHTNIAEINPYYGNALIPLPGFGQPIEALNPRQVQFSIDFEY